MESVVRGELVPFAHLNEVTDWSLVLKVGLPIYPLDILNPEFTFAQYYKINKRHPTASSSTGVKTLVDVGDDTLDRKLSREIVISTVATKMIM